MTMNSALFSGSIAENYHRYLAPLIFDDYAQDLASRVDISTARDVLEIACGTGVLTHHLRKKLAPGARLTATDINPAMVAAARENVDANGTIRYRDADGTQLPFESDSFDVVACQFGVMFYPDKGAGFREAARVLRPGGSFVFNVWDTLSRNRFAETVHYKVVEMFPDEPPAFLAAPFGYNDLVDIKNTLHLSGFKNIALSILPRESKAPSARDVALAFVQGSPLAGELDSLGVADSAFAEVEGALIDAFGAGEVRAPMQSIAITATV